jgi:hypothetical protein
LNTRVSDTEAQTQLASGKETVMESCAEFTENATGTAEPATVADTPPQAANDNFKGVFRNKYRRFSKLRWQANIKMKLTGFKASFMMKLEKSVK